MLSLEENSLLYVIEKDIRRAVDSVIEYYCEPPIKELKEKQSTLVNRKAALSALIEKQGDVKELLDEREQIIAKLKEIQKNIDFYNHVIHILNKFSEKFPDILYPSEDDFHQAETDQIQDTNES